MRLPKEVEAILRGTKPCEWCRRTCSYDVFKFGHVELEAWIRNEARLLFEPAGDVALSLLMSEAAGGEP